MPDPRNAASPGADPVRKRASFEPATRLVGRELATPPARRPASTALGAIFVMGRALVGVLWLWAFSTVWGGIVAEEGIDPEVGDLLLWTVLIGGGLGELVLLALGWLIWRGSNIARVLVMLGLTLSIATAVIGYFSAGADITMETTLLTIAFDILVLLALSSRDARAWSRSHSRRRGERG